ncbi:MAG: hypothetical protein AB7Q37_18645 [Pyrinomonadaceae bacterium]
MTEKERQELRALREMMATDGWTVFIRQMKTDRDSLNRGALAAINTEKDLFYCKGMDEIMNRILNFDKILDASEMSAGE